ncbi:hypothetical protein CDO27_35625 (plasmid) [Sinorhizobium meliloti]|nr:hypothetical protein CDO27_35625 [Sinorhizobium meliloti]CCM69655.1 unnamed protein product [Sinorhizobium meliloti Rm41]
MGGDAAGHVHFDSTSQDAIDTSLMLRLKTILSIFAGRKETVSGLLQGRLRIVSKPICSWGIPSCSQPFRSALLQRGIRKIALAPR